MRKLGLLLLVTPSFARAAPVEAQPVEAQPEEPEATPAPVEADVPAPSPVVEAPPAPVEPAPLPPLDPHSQDPDYVEPNDGPTSPSRKIELGALFGSVIRPSDKQSIHYGTGYFFGGFVRAELAPWMGFRVYYREERVPVDVAPGAFDYQGQKYSFDFIQPDLEIITIAARIEPTWVVTPRLRLFGVLGIGWVRLDAPMPQADGFLLQGKRSATEVNMPLGLGVIYEIIPNWVNTTLSFTYGVAFDQHGRAYEPLQAIVDGKIVYLAPLPTLQSVGDLTFSVGVIL